jgi:hypothetical protein
MKIENPHFLFMVIYIDTVRLCIYVCNIYFVVLRVLNYGSIVY